MGAAAAAEDPADAVGLQLVPGQPMEIGLPAAAVIFGKMTRGRRCLSLEPLANLDTDFVGCLADRGPQPGQDLPGSGTERGERFREDTGCCAANPLRSPTCPVNN